MGNLKTGHFRVSTQLRSACLVSSASIKYGFLKILFEWRWHPMQSSFCTEVYEFMILKKLYLNQYIQSHFPMQPCGLITATEFGSVQHCFYISKQHNFLPTFLGISKVSKFSSPKAWFLVFQKVCTIYITILDLWFRICDISLTECPQSFSGSSFADFSLEKKEIRCNW